jgi:class 3 adenylate cyclase/tetratricopeptide (TPR) repeat protein
LRCPENVAGPRGREARSKAQSCVYAPVVITCPSCGHENPAEQKFCGECGQPLATTRPSLVEERKVVSALFCDLVGFTAASDSADPEDVRARIRPYHDLLRAEIERFGGTVEKFIGDAVMAVFGAPVAHEDDAERAVRSGLRIIEAIEELNEEHPGFALKVRVGIETGEVVVVLGARPELGEGFVTGDIVNTASRLQSVAPQGGVGVGQGTYAATKDIFDYERLDPVSLKGKAEPVAIFHAKAARSRFGTDLTRVRVGALVGRELETSMLQGTFERAVRDRRVQLVTIVGEPGVGKTRQVAELGAHLDERSDALVRWRQGRCLPYGDGITFWALGEIVKAEAGILESDEPGTAKAKLDRALPAEDTDREWMFQRLLPLLGIEAVSAAEREESFAAWRRFLEHLGTDGPAVLVFEDLHWADDALLAFLEHVVEYAEDVPLMLLGTARPELFERHPAWAGTARNANRINLSPLSETEIATLVGQLLGQALLPAGVQQQILERAEGNPLYAEEFIRLLKDREILHREGSTWRFDQSAEVPVPAGIQGLIAARLDTLVPERKAMLQDAAVVGKVFWSGALAEMTGTERAAIEEAMHELSRKELVRKARASSMEGQSEYSFWHGVVRDVCYAQIPRAARAAKHRAAAAWIERVAARVEDHAEILASHYTEALDLLRATGNDEEAQAVIEPAVRYLLLAGDRAKELDAGKAAELYSGALERSSPHSLDRPQLLAKRGAVLAEVGRFADAENDLEEAVRLFRSFDEPRLAAEAQVELANVLRDHGDTETSRALLDEAITVLEAGEPDHALIPAWIARTRDLEFSGRLQEGLAAAERTLAMAQKLGMPNEAARASQFLGMARVELGDLEGIGDLELALQMCLGEDLSSSVTIASYNNLAQNRFVLAGPRGSLELFRQGIDYAERRGHAHDGLWVKGSTLWPLFELGEWDDVLEQGEELLAGDEALGGSQLSVAVRTCLSRIPLNRGELPKAASLVERFLPGARSVGDTQILAPALAHAALLHQATGDTAAAIGLMEEWLHETEGQPLYLAIYLPDAARVLVSGGKRRPLEDAIEASRRYDSPRSRNAAMTASAVLAELTGDAKDAARLYQEAAANWSDFGYLLEQAQALFGAARCAARLGGESGRGSLETARQIFVELRALPLVSDVDGWIADAADSSARES